MLHRNARYIEAGDPTFEVGYNPQTEWKWLITLAFFCGELGAGIFLVSLFLPVTASKLSFCVALLGWLIVAGPKNLFHFIYLGQRWRFWRGLARPGTSWITRGFYGTFALCGFGFLYLVMFYNVVFNGAVPTSADQAIMIIAGISAFVVMIYDGIVMTYSPSIPLWNNSLLPVLRTFYALMGGVTMVLLISMFPALSGQLSSVELHVWSQIERGLVVANLLMIVIYVLTLTYQVTAAKESAFLIIRDKYPMVFWVGVVAVGLIAIFLLPILIQTESLGLLLTVAFFELIGDFCILFLLLRAGVFSPLRTQPNIDVALFARG
ncbi:MAG: NrfD/PsrC family molybdoenzyme membrane anchor subunit [Syntrophales bacterium]|jgi:formate-dependent nitrite reductase membrane component NrfD|nr:NrfD/PsrC family molybdoenzyme membrane anchor subunit [Syntrophales bacterium]